MMHAAPRVSALTVSLATILPLAGVGSAIYLSQQNIPIARAAGIIAAFLIAAAMFLTTGSASARARISRWPPFIVAAVLTIITPLAWQLAGGGEMWKLVATTGIAALIAYWYLIFPKGDLPLLALYGAVALTKASTLLYPVPWTRAPLPVIGELTWLSTLIFAVLIFRRPGTINYGFLPTAQEWTQGVKWFLLFLPAALALAIPIDFARLRPLPPDPAKLLLAVVGTFAGHYIFVALREEFLFRGMLLPVLQKRWGPGRGILATSLVFGAAHLAYGKFPNWKFAVVASVAGYFYARSYLATRSIRSAMVTHALTNVVARVFLST